MTSSEMRPAWPIRTIEECASQEPYSTQIGPFGKALMAHEYVDSGVPVLRGVNVNRGRFHDDDFVFVDEATADRLRKFEAHPGDVLLVHKGTLGQIGLLPKSPRYPRYIMGNSMMRVKCDRGKLLPEYLYYWLSSADGQHYLFSRVSQVGVPQIQTPLSTLRQARLPVPPLQEQSRIIEILGALDDKIELNRRMNETLEGIAKTLFRERFSDAPTEGAITEIAAVISGGTPATDRSEYWDGEYLWASAKDVSQCGEPFLIRTERSITRAGLDESATTLVEPFTTVVVARGATTGRMVMFGSPIAMNQTCYGLRAIEGEHFFLYCLLREHMSTIVHAAHGSVFDTITTATLKSSRMPLHARAARMRFHSDVTPFFERILVNQQGSDTLAQLRDTLLPKLLSGEMRVDTAEKELAGHV